MQVEWRAYLLRPDTPPEGRPHPYPPEVRAERLAPLQAQAEALGLPMVASDWVSSSRLALEAAELARDAGRFDAFHRAVFHAYWAENRDIGQLAVLQDIAREVGLDVDAMTAALNEGRYTQRVDEDVELAAQIGFTGVPAFILGNRAIVGAQPYEAFEHVMGLLGRSKRADVEPTAGS